MLQTFNQAKKVILTNNPRLNVECINGCCYGRVSKPDKGNYFKYCGQSFWEFISNNKKLYTDIIEPLAYKAKQKNETFTKSYAKVINKFTLEFGNEFCLDGEIDWKKLIKFNSSTNPKEYIS